MEVDDVLFGNILYIFLMTIALGICFRVVTWYCERAVAAMVFLCRGNDEEAAMYDKWPPFVDG
jgi:hypothetical protein